MRKFNIKVNGKQYEVEVEELGSSNISIERPVIEEKKEAVNPIKSEDVDIIEREINISEGDETITSPMPGTILSIKTKQGADVKEGEILMILEAMKMENEILSPKSGKIKSLNVKEGDKVNTGQVLTIIE